MSPQYNDMMQELLVKLLLREATPEEQATVQAWIAASEENNRIFLQTKKLWEESRQLAATRPVDVDAAWLRMQQRLQPKDTAPVVPVKKAFNYSWLRIAALFIVLAGGIWWALSTQQEGAEPVRSLALQTTTQPISDTLPDGSIVTLNKASRINYPSKFSGNTRAIALQGEAFFNVAPNKDQPFVITVNDVTVRVVGTSFNIRSEGGKTEVIVETGIVQVMHHNKVVELKPKEKILVQPQDSVLQKEAVADQLHNYYRTKEFVCDNTPLWKLVEVLNEAYDSNIVIGRNSLRNLPLNTTFYNEPLDNILTVISATFDIEVVRKDDAIVLQ
ncbi:FecR domain-containing protein [Pseudocnuella soli]|uniref:FecR domain-containing protein n=1 Tax=Pseudocnuella soli TaxID=2502779 RepID=UPI0010469024|nr:FecR domain-containing protein [Pseudocnuella soli]